MQHEKEYDELLPEPVIQISRDNKLIVTTSDDLRKVLLELLNEAGIHALLPPEREPLPTEMTTGQARKYLISRGWRVVADPYFNKLIKEYDIPRQKKGKEYWYKVEDLRKIPSRI